MRKQPAHARYLRPIVTVSIVLTASIALAGNHHWGVYIQGHAPALVPHCIQYGFNQQRWRRWPEECVSDHVYPEAETPVPKETEPEQLPATEEPQQPPADEDLAPPPPGAAEESMPETEPQQQPSETQLQPLPVPRDAGPEPPPGLTEPEPSESAPPPSPLEQPPSSEETPQLPPETEPTAPPGEPTPAGPPAPGTVPAPTPGVPLPVPPTKLESRRRLPDRAPSTGRRDAGSFQARQDRANAADEDAREAVFREDSARDASAQTRVRNTSRVRDTSRSRPDTQPQVSGPDRMSPGQPKLFQPARPTAPQHSEPAAVKRISYEAHARQAAQASWAATSDPRIASDHLPRSQIAVTEASTADKTPGRANPLRDAAGNPRDMRDAGDILVNPLRNGRQ